MSASAAVNTAGIGKAANPLMPVTINQIPSRSIPALRVTRTAMVHLEHERPHSHEALRPEFLLSGNEETIERRRS